MTDQHPPLLGPEDPPPVTVDRPDGRSPLLLVCDHAGRRVPGRLAALGLGPDAFERHIAWDVGIADVSRRVAEALDATLVCQRYSRLVIDCNRPPGVASSIPEVSEATPIPGNLGLSAAEREVRRRELFEPYHARIAAELDRREAEGRPVCLVAMHSFTPVYLSDERPWQIGTLYGRDGRLARTVFELLGEDGTLVVGDNQPYDVTDATDHTIPVHGERRGLLHVGIEIRQDLISREDGQAAWAERMIEVLPRAVAAFLP